MDALTDASVSIHGWRYCLTIRQRIASSRNQLVYKVTHCHHRSARLISPRLVSGSHDGRPNPWGPKLWDKYEMEESDAPWRVPHAERHIPRDVTDVSITTTRKWLVNNFHLQLKERSGLVGCRSPSTTGCAFHIPNISGLYAVLKDNAFRGKPPARAPLQVVLPSEDDNSPEDSLSECCGHSGVSL